MHSLSRYTITEIDNLLTATNTAFHNATVHLSHPTIHITLNNLSILHTRMCPSITHNMSHRIIFHHLCLSTQSSLIPMYRFLSLTMDNTTHPLTLRGTETLPTNQHYLHLLLNSYKRSPHLQYIYQG